MKKKKILPVLIGILISISSFADDATQNAIYERLGQVLDEASQNRAINETHNSNFRSFVTEKFTPMANNIGSSMSYLNLINTIVQKMGTADGGSGTWFNTMYMLALDMQSKYNQLVSDLDDLYEHVSTTQNYQLEDIKTSNQTIRDNTTSIKDTTKNIETSTDVIEGHTETIASDTTSLKNLFNKESTISHYTLNPSGFRPYVPSLDFANPKGIIGGVKTYSFTDHILFFLSELSAINSEHTVVDRSSLMNLQAIRTNLAEIAKHVTSNTTDKVVVDTLPDITADLLPEYGINVGTHDLPNVQENFTGDFHNDLLKLTRFNASVNISASYASISILTNLQSLLARNADQLQAEQKESLETGIEAARNEYDDAEQFWENDSSSENLAVQNKSMLSYKDTRPNFGSLGASSPADSIGFTIEAIRLSDDESPINLDVSAQVSHETRNLVESIRAVCTVVLWGVGLVLTYFLLGLMSKLFSWALGLIHPLPVQSGLFMKTENGGIV